jgi:putative Holliday junction resolvase
MYLAIDWGKKRIGLAVGSVIPKGAGVIDGAKKREEILSEIEKVAKEYEVNKVVIGLPIRSGGEEGNLANEIREFGEAVKNKLNVPVEYEPEQFTSSEAEKILEEQGHKFNRDEGKVDELAAVLILEQFLNEKEH